MTPNDSVRIGTLESASWPRFADIAEPRMVALCTGNGSGTKLFQGFLDGHPQIYMIAAYPLMYLYPHWEQWRHDLADQWTWEAIVDAFCRQHASVIDPRRIPGHDGMTTLGEHQDQWLEIDEELFRAYLLHLLEGQPIASRTFLLAVHYAHAFCRGEDPAPKKILVYHIHVSEYVPRYLVVDFPRLLTLALTRDPRSSMRRRYRTSFSAVDDHKLNRSDAIIYRRRAYTMVCRYLLNGQQALRSLDADRTRVIRHEDLVGRLEDVLRAVADYLGIDFVPELLQCTFGGISWWGDKIYEMQPMNLPNPRVVSLDWQHELHPLDWFVLEGLLFDYCKMYGYELYRYTDDTVLNRILLFGAILLPSQIERQLFRAYFNPQNFLDFVQACRDEATLACELKDYSFNAYYRHKWTTRDLNLWKPRWWMAFLLRTREGLAARPDSRILAWSARLGQATYVLVNVCRYGWCVATYPAAIAGRWRVSLAAFLRQARKANVLRDALP